jgi:hypothetical protein
VSKTQTLLKSVEWKRTILPANKDKHTFKRVCT